jgi:hypothetical protein
VSEEISKIEGSNVTIFEWEPEDIIEQALQELIISWKIYYPELVAEIMKE